LAFDGHQDRLIQEHNESTYLAWRIADLLRAKPVKLDRLLIKPGAKPQHRFQTPEERWSALAGAANRTSH
jgi:hypothetical protein